MSEDWRLRVNLHQDGVSSLFTARLESRELTHDLETSFQDRVVVSTDGPEMFCYAGTREQAEGAEQLIRKVADEHDWEIDFELKRWHPIAEEWRDPDEALPGDAVQRAEEHAELVEDQREESAEQGHPNYEVRVQSNSHHDIVKLAERLQSEGFPVVRRWHFLLLGAADEDDANALADRIRGEVPEGSVVKVEGNLREVVDEQPPNPFAFLGGLGG
jgi:hypothetical protein